jgi:two-component system response regulator MprA
VNVGKQTNPSVLIVDDDDEIRYSLRNLLLVSDYDVALAADGLEALKVLERSRVDAVIVDLMMPRLDGVGVIRALMRKPEEERPRVILVISAHIELRRRIMGLQVRRVFPKPFDAMDLVDELGAALAEGEGHRPPNRGGRPDTG